MKRVALAAVLFLLPNLTRAQSHTSHSGWNFTDTLQNATDVLVADVISGAGLDDGTQVQVNARVSVVRVLQGEMIPGAVLNLRWQYRPLPYESPEVTSKVPAIRALWFLRKVADGMEGLPVPGMFTPLGGVPFPVPEAAPSGALFYIAESPLQLKIASEIGWALEDLVARHGSDLTPHQPEAPLRGVPAPWVQTQMQFRSTCMLLTNLDVASTNSLYRHFATLSDLHLKSLGLLGRIHGGDTDAVLELEKELPHLTANMDPGATQYLMGIDVKNNPAAAHALARMALSNLTIPGLDVVLASQIGWTKRPEFLPYLVAFLSSPNASTRDGAVLSFCTMLQPAFWKPEMSGYCPTSTPVNDTEQERKDVQFWRQWFEAHREEIGKTTSLVAISPPARYSSPGNEWREASDVPMEIRLQSLLAMSGKQAAQSPVDGLLNIEDRAILGKVFDSTTTKLEEQQKKGIDILNAARVASSAPDREKLKSVETARQAVLTSALQDLKSRLSSEGWQSLERFLLNMSIHAIRPMSSAK